MTCETIVLVYYTGFKISQDENNLDFSPGVITMENLTNMIAKGKSHLLPDPNNNLIWINYRKAPDVSSINRVVPKVKKYQRIDMKKLTKFTPLTVQN